MIALFGLFLALFASPFKSKSRLEAENAALRRQLIILRRKVRGRVRLTNGDRLFFIQLYRWFPSVLKAITIVRPETLVLARSRSRDLHIFRQHRLLLCCVAVRRTYQKLRLISEQMFPQLHPPPGRERSNRKAVIQRAPR
jgi:hypothetical protein